MQCKWSFVITAEGDLRGFTFIQWISNFYSVHPCSVKLTAKPALHTEWAGQEQSCQECEECSRMCTSVHAHKMGGWCKYNEYSCSNYTDTTAHCVIHQIYYHTENTMMWKQTKNVRIYNRTIIDSQSYNIFCIWVSSLFVREFCCLFYYVPQHRRKIHLIVLFQSAHMLHVKCSGYSKLAVDWHDL